MLPTKINLILITLTSAAQLLGAQAPGAAIPRTFTAAERAAMHEVYLIERASTPELVAQFCTSRGETKCCCITRHWAHFRKPTPAELKVLVQHANHFPTTTVFQVLASKGLVTKADLFRPIATEPVSDYPMAAASNFAIVRQLLTAFPE